MRVEKAGLALLAVVLFVVGVFPADAGAAGSVFVTAATAGVGPHPGDVSQYTIASQGGALSPKSPPTIPTGTNPGLIAVTPGGRSAYVANGNDADVSQYDVNASTGLLSPKSPPTVAAGVGPFGITVSPDGKSAYVVNYADSSVSQYDIDPVTGALSPKSPPVVATGSAPRNIAVTPDGKSAYVTATDAGGPNSGIWQYDVNPTTGTLSPKSPASFSSGPAPWAIAITPDGKNAYVTQNWGSAYVSQFTIDPVTGALSPKTPASIATGTFPWGIAVTPDGKSAYVTNRPDAGGDGDNGVSQYDIDPVNGTLSPKTPATVTSDSDPIAVAVAPDGKSAYVANNSSSTVTQYDIDQTTGRLSQKTPGSVATDLRPLGIAVGPLPDGYPRPRGAGPFLTYLVPAYNACTSPNRTHGAPLAFGSCAPPAQTSNQLTLGTPDANGHAAATVGSVRYRVTTGDVKLDVNISGVLTKSSLSPYGGELALANALRITDRNNTPGASGPGPGTVQDTSFAVTVPCSAGTCSVATTANAVAPGAVLEGKRALWQTGQVRVYDGGADGVASTTGDNTLFMVEGLFVP